MFQGDNQETGDKKTAESGELMQPARKGRLQPGHVGEQKIH